MTERNAGGVDRVGRAGAEGMPGAVAAGRGDDPVLVAGEDVTLPGRGYIRPHQTLP